MKYLGTTITQPYISKITLEPATDDNIKVTITIHMDNTKMESLAETMQTSIIKIADKNIIERLTQNNKKAIIELIENSKKNGSLGDIDISKAEVKVFSLGFESEFTQEFLVNKKISDLSFYVVCQYNPDHPHHAKIISSSPSYKDFLIRTSAIVSEDVFRNRALVREANIFVFRDPSADLSEEPEDHSVSEGGTRIWTGPVSPAPEGFVGLLSGQRPDQGPKLNLVSVPNTTLHDYRVLDKISKINFNCKLLENKPLINKRNANFSNLYMTNDKNGFARLFFAADIGEIIKNNSKLPRLVSSETEFSLALSSNKPSFDEIMNLSEIKNIVIKREKVDQAGNLSAESKSHTDGQQIIAKSSQAGAIVPPSEYSIKKDIHIPQDIENTREIIGKLTEVKGIHLDPSADFFSNLTSPKQVRYFGATDLSLERVKSGLYRYSVELEIDDGTMKYIKRLAEDLKEGQRAMELYSKDLKSGNLKEDYMINGKGPWVWALNILLKAIKSFDNVEVFDEQQMYILSSPRTATLESISRVVDIYNNVTSFIQKMAEEFPNRNKRNIDEMNPDAVISGKKTITQSISINHTFSEVFDAENNGEVGYDYHDVDFGSKTSEIGLMTFSSAAYTGRTINENLRFFDQKAQQKGILANNEKYKNELSTTQFSYLTPALIRILGKSFRTYGVASDGAIQNSSELGHFNMLMDLYSYKTIGNIQLKNIPTLAEVERSKSKTCTVDNIFSQKSNEPSTQAKRGLIQNMATINTIALQKHESPCNEQPEKEDNAIAKLMHNSAVAKYEEELQEKDDRENHADKTAEAAINPSFIFAPLFYMNKLDIEKEICCSATALNLNTGKQSLSTTEFKFLPNQLKAMAASSAGSTLTKQTWYTDNKPLLKELKNAAFYYLNQKNIALIEVLIGFENGALVSPTWVRLRRDHLENAARSSNKKLLCRLSPYSNSKLCYSRNRILDLNLFNQYFLINTEGLSQTMARPQKRTIKPVETFTVLDNNSLLKINSNFIRTNIAFGQAVSPTRKRRARAGARPATTAPRTTTTTTPGGMGSGGGRSY